MYDICCIGHLTRDLIVTPHGEARMTGGTAYYFSKAMVGMGLRYKLVTAMAAADRDLAAGLIEAGIDISIHDIEGTLYFENRYGHNADERTQRVLEVARPFTRQQLEDCNAAMYHLGALLANDFSGELIVSLAARGRISLDVQGMLRKVTAQQVTATDWVEKLRILPLVHTLKASEEEARVLTGIDDLTTAAQQIAAWGVQEVVITMGGKGSIVYSDGTLYTIPAFTPSQLIDATGCGDTYMAGYLYQRFAGKGIDQAGCFAAAMASMKIATNGAFEGTEAAVWKMVATGSMQ